MSAHRHSPTQEDIPALLRKAARERERGDFRRAMALYKRAAFDAQERAGLWTRYALCCVTAGQAADGARAFSQAIWLLERQGRRQGAAVTRQLAEIASSGQLPDNYARHRSATWHDPAWRAAVRCAFSRPRAAVTRQNTPVASSKVAVMDQETAKRCGDTAKRYGARAPL